MIYSTKLPTRAPVTRLEREVFTLQEPCFQVGELVQIIDSDEDPREWGKFIIIEIKSEKCRLETLDGINKFWVTDTEICRG